MLRPDQIARIEELQEELADVFIQEADPTNWTAAGKLPNEMSKDERGDRHWDRKGAMGTGAVLKYTFDVLKAHANPDDKGDGASDEDLDAVIASAEKKAKAALSRVMNKAQGKAEFDKRTHGKAH